MLSVFTCYAKSHFTVNNGGVSKTWIFSKFGPKLSCRGYQSVLPDIQNINLPPNTELVSKNVIFRKFGANYF